MADYLLTWKETGWPYEDVLRKFAEFQANGFADETWRISAYRRARVGDRTWVLRQGQGPKTIFAMGHIIEPPYRGLSDAGKMQGLAKVRFDHFVDPNRQALVPESVVVSVLRPSQVRSQASGNTLEDRQARAFVKSMDQGPQPVQMPAKKITGAGEEKSASNPDWTRDELIVALNVYLRHRPNPPAQDSKKIAVLSQQLQALGEKLFSPDRRAATFRNNNGVYMKLMNFRRLDPEYTSGGRKGLTRGAKGEEAVWHEFGKDPERCARAATAIMAGISDRYAMTGGSTDFEDDGLEDAPEGRLLTRIHIGRERDRSLVTKKINRVLKQHGKLECEVCEFDFAARYGNRGSNFIECHHLRPVSTLEDGHRTNLGDLALVCSNCHRMIHRRKPWLSIGDLKDLLKRG